MNKLIKIHEITINLLELFKKWDAKEIERDQLIQEVVPLLASREQLITALESPYTDEEMILGRKILSLNERLETNMNDLFQMVKGDIKQLKQNKELNYSYIKQYGDIKTTDGMYVDNKL